MSSLALRLHQHPSLPQKSSTHGNRPTSEAVSMRAGPRAPVENPPGGDSRARRPEDSAFCCAAAKPQRSRKRIRYRRSRVCGHGFRSREGVQAGRRSPRSPWAALPPKKWSGQYRGAQGSLPWRALRSPSIAHRQRTGHPSSDVILRRRVAFQFYHGSPFPVAQREGFTLAQRPPPLFWHSADLIYSNWIVLSGYEPLEWFKYVAWT
jgi:hypothetical protein